MTGFSGFRLHGVLLAAAILAGGTVAGTDTASAQGRIVCQFGSAKYQRCCRHSYREHAHLKARARADDIDACMSGRSSDRDEEKRVKRRSREDQEETRKSKPREEREESREEQTKKKSRTSDAAQCSGPASGKAGVHTCEKFAIWLPADWKVKSEEDGLSAEGEDLTAVVGWLEDTELKDKEVTQFIREEMADVRMNSDQNDKRDDLDVRLMEGTGKDTEEDDKLTFRALALGTGNGVIEVVVYGEPDAMKENEAAIDRILTSLSKP
jgi:hypothetical protein